MNKIIDVGYKGHPLEELIGKRVMANQALTVKGVLRVKEGETGRILGLHPNPKITALHVLFEGRSRGLIVPLKAIEFIQENINGG